MQKRLEHYDNAKGILILLVVMGHLLAYANPDWSIKPYILAHSYIASFHMPAFFALSGMLFDAERWQKRSWGAFLTRRVRTLAVPYLFFELLAILYLHFVLHAVTIPEGLLHMVRLECNIGADWFLPAMFFASLLFFSCVKLLYGRTGGRIIGGLLAAAGLFASWVIPAGVVGNQLIRGLLGFGFLYFGNLLRPWLERHSPARIGLAFLLSVGAAILAFFFADNDFYTCRVTIPPLFLVSGLSGLYCVLGISKAIHWRPLALLGENSIVVLGTHQLVLYTVAARTDLLWILTTFALICAVELPLIWSLNRFAPFLIGKKQERNSST